MLQQPTRAEPDPAGECLGACDSASLVIGSTVLTTGSAVSGASQMTFNNNTGVLELGTSGALTGSLALEGGTDEGFHYYLESDATLKVQP